MEQSASQYDNSIESESHSIHEHYSPKCGGVGTTLRGIVHFTSAAESHKGLCHGGAMCSVFDDIIGWTAFSVTGVCIPWSGYTVEVNTRLKPYAFYWPTKSSILKIFSYCAETMNALQSTNCMDSLTNVNVDIITNYGNFLEIALILYR
jgi:hypothetical protein